MEPAVHRRIELQSPDDLTYLIDNVRRAAADSINAAFPPVDNAADGQEDELRNRIEQLVNEYILTTFTLAAPNLTINGLPVDPSQFLSSLTSSSSPSRSPSKSTTIQRVHYEYEPFDPRKRDRIEELVAQEEDLLRSLAHLKRRAPRATAQRWAEATRAGIAADEAALAAACARAAAEEEGGDGASGSGVGAAPLERQDEVEGRFRRAVETLGRLKREMPVAVARMERARVAAEYVADEGR
ncbi:hypothetical protein VTK56DRAFT_1411 [Thermocarpiscus australiensis]